VTGLTPGVVYHFSVAADNARGASAGSSTMGVVLSLPTVAVDAGMAIVSWTAPSWAGDPSAHYRFVLSPVGPACSTVATTACTLDGVTSADSYHVSLELRDASGRVMSTLEGTVHEVSLLQAYFNVGSYRLSSATESRITALARELAKDHVRAVTIYGHTDRSGASPYNLVLSHRRAQAVATYLYAQLRLLGDTSVRIHVVSEGISTASALYALDRNAIVVTSTP